MTGATVVDNVPAALVRRGLDLRRRPAAPRAERHRARATSTPPSTCRSVATATYLITATVVVDCHRHVSSTRPRCRRRRGVDRPEPRQQHARPTPTRSSPTADLSITKTDGQTTATPGQAITYTIVATNAGPSTITGATVADTVPADLTGVTWTCVGIGGFVVSRRRFGRASISPSRSRHPAR